MNWAGCETDNSVITMRNGACRVATVLGRREGVVGTVENWRAALCDSASRQLAALQESEPGTARSDFSMSARSQVSQEHLTFKC